MFFTWLTLSVTYKCLHSTPQSFSLQRNTGRVVISECENSTVERVIVHYRKRRKKKSIPYSTRRELIRIPRSTLPDLFPYIYSWFRRETFPRITGLDFPIGSKTRHPLIVDTATETQAAARRQEEGGGGRGCRVLQLMNPKTRGCESCPEGSHGLARTPFFIMVNGGAGLKVMAPMTSHVGDTEALRRCGHPPHTHPR